MLLLLLSAQVVIVGGGYIGMEVAAALSGHGVQITMVFPEQFLLARLFTPELAAFYAACYEAKGIRLVKKSLVKEVLGESGKVRLLWAIVKADCLCFTLPIRAAVSLLRCKIQYSIPFIFPVFTPLVLQTTISLPPSAVPLLPPCQCTTFLIPISPHSRFSQVMVNGPI